MKKHKRDKGFSVTFSEAGLKEIKKHLDNVYAETGFRMSRNMFVYRASVALARYFELKNSGDWENVSIEEIFKSVE